MTVQKVALIFDNQIRPDTTGVYCKRALEKLVGVKHFLLGDLQTIPRSGFDLYLNIDDGLEYRLPGDLRPSAWWAIDTHLNAAWCRERARDFDFVFAAQRDGAEQLQDAGIASACWLPLACDPDIHRKHDVPKTLDVCFVGHLFPGPRAECLERIRRHFPDHFIGQRFFEEMARTYSAARLVFNRSIRNDVNMRVFEALACGSLLLTNDLQDNGQDDLFRDGVHLATYGDANELVDKIRFYLTHEALRERIAEAGRAAVLARDTYRHRMEWLLGEVERGLAKKRSRQAGGPAPAHSAGRAPEQISEQQPGLTASLGEGRTTGSLGMESGPWTLTRPELLHRIPGSACKILAVGHGVGAFRSALTERREIEVVGIETGDATVHHPHDLSADALDANPGGANPLLAPAAFDLILGAGLLEYQQDPSDLLRRLISLLTPTDAWCWCARTSVIIPYCAGFWPGIGAGRQTVMPVRIRCASSRGANSKKAAIERACASSMSRSWQDQRPRMGRNRDDRGKSRSVDCESRVSSRLRRRSSMPLAS
jgi:hypothetical protein